MTKQERIGGQILYILVVDPDVNERFTLSMLLQRFGYTAVSANNAKEAVEFLCVAPAVAVFAEAGAAGSELQARLSADARFSEVPVVLITDIPNRGLEDRLQRGKLAGLLRKPLNADDVFLIIQKVIEKGPRRNIRIATAIPAALKDESAVAKGYITVLSQYGLFFRTLQPRPVHSNVCLAFSLWDRSIELEARVLYIVSFEEGPFREPGMGMKFQKMSPENSALIKAFIREQIEEGIMLSGPGLPGGVA